MLYRFYMFGPVGSFVSTGPCNLEVPGSSNLEVPGSCNLEVPGSCNLEVSGFNPGGAEYLSSWFGTLYRAPNCLKAWSAAYGTVHYI